MAREPIVIGDREFPTKKAAKDFFKDMLNRYRNKQEVDCDDRAMLEALIERHPEAHQKIGCGIRRFYKRKADQGTSCFWIERSDGSETDFSYISCVDMKGQSLYQEFAEACRQAVRDELKRAKEDHYRKFKDAEGCVRCEETGEMLHIYEAHLDHKKPMTFEVIVRTFIASLGFPITREMLSLPRDVQFATTLVDPMLAARFRKYHTSLAQLRIVKAQRNLSLGGRERIRPPVTPVVLPSRMPAL